MTLSNHLGSPATHRLKFSLAVFATWLLGIGVSTPAQAQVPLSGPVGSGFGSALATWRTNAARYVVVGAPQGSGLHGTVQGGRAFLYQSNGAGFDVTELDPGASLPFISHFGATVVMKSGFVFVGAPGASAVYIFGDGSSSAASWANVTRLGPNGANFGQSLDYDVDMGVLVACGAGLCSFYSRQGQNWLPTQAANGIHWPTIVANRAQFVWTGDHSDLLTGSANPLEPGAIRFYRLKSGTIGYQPSTTFTANGGVFGGFASSPLGALGGEIPTRVLVTGPTPGDVQTFVPPHTEGVPGDPPYLQLTPIRLSGAGAPGAQVGTGIALMGDTAFITDRFSLTGSQILSYVRDGKGTVNPSDDTWTLDPNVNLGNGGPTYGAAPRGHARAMGGGRPGQPQRDRLRQ